MGFFCFACLLFLLFCCCFFYQSCNGQKQSSLTEVRRAQIVSLHGEGYTERDIAANLRCSNTAVLNAVVKFNADATFHVRKRSGRPRKTTLREDHAQGRPLNEKESSNALAKVLLRETRAVVRLKYTAMSSSTVVRRLGKGFGLKSHRSTWKPHLTPMLMKIDWTLPDIIAIGLSLRLFSDECTMQ